MREVTAVIGGLVLISAILLDAFEAIVLPRRVTRTIRPTRLFYALTWIPWSALARRMKSGKRRESFLGTFGPLSMIMLLAFWAAGMIVGFALLGWALSRAGTRVGPPFTSELYLSGTTFFTLGLGDVTPSTPATRVLAVLEAGIGFGFLALVIGYLPVIYAAFSRREVWISLLDARAGSPPSALELLRHYGKEEHHAELRQLLRDFELWSADLMESQLSYPVLCYYRSQHDNQSWLAALTTLLDTCALLMAREGGDLALRMQARMTFAIARHAAVDLAQVLRTAPRELPEERLPEEVLARLRGALVKAGASPEEIHAAAARLAEYRKTYEPYVAGLSDYVLMALPRFDATTRAMQNWKTSAWGRVGLEPAADGGDGDGT